MKHHLLFDNNIYRPLMTSENGEFLKNFNDSIKKHKVIQNIPSDNFNYSITPFSIMEALGVTIPYPEIIIPVDKLTEKTFKDGFKFLKKEAEKYFRNLKNISPEKLLKNAIQQSLFTNSESKEFENILIYKPLRLEGFNEYFIQALVFDYLCKYEFPKEIQRLVFSEFLIPTFFMSDREISRFSKFRIIKRLWDNSYYELKKEKIIPESILIDLHKSMELKKKKDFLDCEIIHFSCVGDLSNDIFNPVFSFTTDKKSTIINRVIVYKSMINLFINTLITEEQYSKNKSLIESWKQGMIILCDKNGRFIESIDISNIKTIN